MTDINNKFNDKLNKIIAQDEKTDINDKVNEVIIKECGGSTLLLLFQKLKKKIANFNIRMDKVEQHISENTFDIANCDTTLEEMEEKLNSIHTALEQLGVQMDWPEKPSVCDTPEEDKTELEIAAEKRTALSANLPSTRDAEFWTNKELCCWTCIHSIPRYEKSNVSELHCGTSQSYAKQGKVSAFSKCYLYVKSSLRDWPPPTELNKGFYGITYNVTEGKGRELPVPNITFMGVDINTGEEKCWE